MAVYKRTYHGFAGPTTKRCSRFLVPMHFSYARLFQSKLLVLYLVLCLFYPFCCLAFIYLLHSPAFFFQFGLGAALSVGIDGRFFYFFAVVQGALAYLLTALVGPGLIAPDIANGALPLYFCRPFSRIEYVLGKASVLFVLLSLITWIPGLFLYMVQISVAGWAWGRANVVQETIAWPGASDGSRCQSEPSIPPIDLGQLTDDDRIVRRRAELNVPFLHFVQLLQRLIIWRRFITVPD